VRFLLLSCGLWPASAVATAQEAKPAPAADGSRQEAIAKALAGLQEASLDRRLEALSRGHQLRAVEAVPQVLELLTGEREARERAAAISVLTALDCDRVVPRLRDLLDLEQHDVCVAAAHGLAMFRDEQSMQRVAEVLGEDIAAASKDQLWYLGM